MADTDSPDAVAFALWSALRETKEPVEAQLVFFAKCRRATRGLGEYAVKNASG